MDSITTPATLAITKIQNRLKKSSSMKPEPDLSKPSVPSSISSRVSMRRRRRCSSRSSDSEGSTNTWATTSTRAATPRGHRPSLMPNNIRSQARATTSAMAMDSARSRARRRLPRNRRMPSTTDDTMAKHTAAVRMSDKMTVSIDSSLNEPLTNSWPTASHTSTTSGMSSAPPTTRSAPNIFRASGVRACPLPMPGSGCKGVC